MRLLFLNPIGNIGGGERVLLTAIAGIRQTCPEAALGLITLSDGPLVAAARAFGAHAEVVNSPPSLNAFGDSQMRDRGFRSKVAFAARAVPASIGGLRLYTALRSAIRRFAPDIVHSNGIKTHLLSPFTVPRGVPLVWHMHDFCSLRPTSVQLLRRLSGRVRAAVAISRAVAVDIARVLPKVPITTILNATDVVRFSPGKADGPGLDRLAGLSQEPEGTVRIGLIATYARWKGHFVFLDAAAKLAAESPALPVRWYIVGGPIYHTASQFSLAELQTAVAERKLSKRVGFIGFTSDTPSIYRSLDVVVHASTLPEPFGLTIVEAMACGRPVIVSAAGGAAELFTDGVDALGFTPSDAAQLAQAIRRLVEEPALRSELGVAARRTAETRFDSNHYGKQLLEVYRSILPSQPS